MLMFRIFGWRHISSLEISDKTYSIVVIISIFLIGAVLRIYRLDFQSMWVDEVATAIESSGSIKNIIFDPQFNMKIPPLHNIITHYFLSAEHREFWMRLPSALFGSMTIAFLYLLIKNWFNTKIALISAFLLAISPFHIWYSQEVRAYAMIVFFAVLTMYFFNQVLINQTNLLSRIGFILSLTLTFYSHSIAASFLILVFIISIVAPAQNRKKVLKQWFMTYAIFTILIIPAIYLVLSLPVMPTSPEKKINMLYFYIWPYVLWAFGTGYSLGPNLADLQDQSRMSALLDAATIIIPVLLIFFILITIGTIGVFKKYHQHSFKILLWFLFPLFFTIVAAMFEIESFNVRYAILSFPAFIVLLAVGINMLKTKLLRLLAITVITVISLASLYNYYYVDRYQREDNRGAGHFLSQNASSGDIVLCSASYTLMALKYYCDKDELQWIGIAGDDPVSEIGQARLENLNHVWLFRSRNFHGDPNGEIPKYLDQIGYREREFSSNGVNLVKYILNPSK